MEAILGAVYLDGGLEAARAVYQTGWDSDIDALAAKPANPKSQLQESLAKRGLVPRYDLSEQGGPDHRPVFTVHVYVDGYAPAFGTGGSKQAAERAAAEAFLQRESL